MALANIACLLARQPSEPEGAITTQRKVLAIDWDFEAPGLHRYFLPYLTDDSSKRFDEAPGCIDLFRLLDNLRPSYDPADYDGNRRRALQCLEAIDLTPFLIETTFPGLSFIKAGRLDLSYQGQVACFNWEEFFKATIGLFSGVADFLRSQFDYILIDSRTGITDTSGICTMLLPDKLVVVFTPNLQSFTGIEVLIGKALAYRKGSPDGRALSVFPLPSRIEMARPQLFEAWRGFDSRTANTESQLQLPNNFDGYEIFFERLFARLYARVDISLKEYFDEVLLQQIPDYAYGEPIAVALENTDSRVSLSGSYSAFCERLIELNVPWSSLGVRRLDREVDRICNDIKSALLGGDVELSLQLCFALLERMPTASEFERAAGVALEASRAAYPRGRESASNLVRRLSEVARARSDLSFVSLGRVLCDAGRISKFFGDLLLAFDLLRASQGYFSDSLGVDHPASLMAMEEAAAALRGLGHLDDASALYTEAISIRQKALGKDHPGNLHALVELATIHLDRGSHDEVGAALRRAIELGAEYAEESPEALSIKCVVARERDSVGELPRARELLERVVAVRRRLLGEEDAETLSATISLASIQRRQGDLATARLLEERVVEVRRQVLGEDHPDTLTAMTNLATTLWSQGDLGGARALEGRVLDRLRVVLGDDHPDTLTAMNNLAASLWSAGDVTGAIDLEKRVLSLRTRIQGEAHPDTLTAMSNLASSYWTIGNLGRARELQEVVLASRRKVQGDDHPATATAMLNLAGTLWKEGNLAGARELEEKVVDARRRVLGEEHPDTLTAINNLATTLQSQGDLVESRSLREASLEISRRVLGEDHPDTLSTMARLADLARAEGRWKDALGLGEHVLLARERILGENHPSTIESMRNLGETCRLAGETQKAFELLERALHSQEKEPSLTSKLKL